MADIESEVDKCPKCGESHPGLRSGDLLPDDIVIRRGIPSDKIKPDGSIGKSAFKDPKMSVDLAANRTPAQTLSPSHLHGGQYVEFTVEEAKAAFPGNAVVFDCVPGNPYHCEIIGRKTDQPCNKFAENMRSSLKRT